MDHEDFCCPLDDAADFPGSTNCGGRDFGSRLALDIHFAEQHFRTGPPVRLALAGRKYPSTDAAYAEALCTLHPNIASEDPDFPGAPAVAYSSGWGMLGTAAGLGQGLPQSRYVIWSQGTPIAWYLNDWTDEGWVFPRGDYYTYDRITSRHQNKIGAALKLVGEHPKVNITLADPWHD